MLESHKKPDKKCKMLLKKIVFGNSMCMKKLYLGKIFDFVLWGSFLFFVSFVWARYFFKNFWTAVLASIFITSFAMIVFRLINRKKLEKQKIELIKQKNASAISTDLLLKTKQEILKIFFEKLSVKYDVKIKSDFLIVNSSVVRPIYVCKKITDKDIIESYKKARTVNAKKLIIVCKEADETATEIIKMINSFEIVLLTEIDAYKNIFEPLKFEIPKIEEVKKEQKKFSEYLSFALNKSRTKNYVLVSIFMLFSSFVLRYNIYYLLFASVTAFLAIYSHFNTKFNKKSQNLL